MPAVLRLWWRAVATESWTRSMAWLTSSRDGRGWRWTCWYAVEISRSVFQSLTDRWNWKTEVLHCRLFGTILTYHAWLFLQSTERWAHSIRLVGELYDKWSVFDCGVNFTAYQPAVLYRRKDGSCANDIHRREPRGVQSSVGIVSDIIGWSDTRP